MNLTSEGRNTGWNRFEVFSQYRTNPDPKKDFPVTLTVVLKTEKEHQFEYDIDDSRLPPCNPCISIDYSKYQHDFSLWKSMKDEVRMLPSAIKSASEHSEAVVYEVMIGLGSMTWSGGILNCSPFCLYRKL